ncbi:hypothetical protein [Leptolyngbya sp. PCC 6406]|uniref:hypothetical protein n=1 Tax=Leptolyngbya sp. PCC 6406 TaxID=1173264 RepID=UPI0002AD0706|nr:hypothetical protein [Leptolyngbya sp. PCC 6406]
MSNPFMGTHQLGDSDRRWSDGEIRYKTSIDVEGDRLTPALIKRLVYANVMMMDTYRPGLLAVLESTTTPEDAIHWVETGESTEGRAIQDSIPSLWLPGGRTTTRVAPTDGSCFARILTSTPRLK